MIFTMIGSRKTPQDVLSRMTAISKKLCSSGWTLRSGGADGADMAGEKGCDAVGGQKEIFLPWKGFNGNNSPHFEPPDRAYILASELHPVWDKLKDSVKRLHARNTQQILGMNLDQPSNLVIAYTENGALVGGTATALKLAVSHDISVINLGLSGYSEEKLWEIVSILELAIRNQSNKALSEAWNDVVKYEE